MPNLSDLEKKLKASREEEQNRFVELNYESLKKSWDEFCVAKKSKGLSDEFVTLSNALIELDPEDRDVVRVTFEYEDNMKHFTSFQSEFLVQLSRKLRKPEIKFDVVLMDRSNEKKKIFTDDDKFKYIAQKYPELNELQKRLGLDFEY